MASNNKLARLDQEYNKQKELILNSTLSEEQKQKRIAELEENTDKKRKEIERRQAKRNKAQAIFNATINTIEAVSKALAMGNLILAGIFGTLGAIQIGLIAAEPLPELADGGLIRKREGGVRAIIGEGNDDEIVLPMRKGAFELADMIMDKIGNYVIPQPQMAFAGSSLSGGNTTTQARPVQNVWNIGTLIADDNGIKELERRMMPIRIQEQQRRGL
jgi:hypothetical protein